MITFTYQFESNSPKVMVELSAESTLPEVIEAFETFLRAATYSVDGHLEVVSDEEIPEENKKMGCNHPGDICKA